ncbi:hypothetical protein QBC44DRAFT_312273 [Cladorrhinum sp. PSN332]|nr:hypothetical protein QBC44DRAFT_312273 [Cladorrhinum sp. PSN332]
MDDDDDRDRGHGGGRGNGGGGSNNNSSTSTKEPAPEPTTTVKNDPPAATTTQAAPVQPAPTTNSPDKPSTTQAPVVNPPATTGGSKPAETQKPDAGGNNGSGSPAAPATTRQAAPGSGSGSGQVGGGAGAGAGGGNSAPSPNTGAGNNGNNNNGAQNGSGTGSSSGGSNGSSASAGAGAAVGGAVGGGGGGGAAAGDTIGPGSGGSSSAGASSGADKNNSSGSLGGIIAGIVIGFLALLALIALLLFLFRKKPKVQRLLSRFRKGGDSRPGSSYPTNTSGPDGMGNNLINPFPLAGTAHGGAAAGFAAAPVMRHTSRRSRLNVPPPLLPLSANPNRVSSPTGESLASSRGAFTPSPVSPLSPASMLSPPGHGGAPVPYPGRPQYVPPKTATPPPPPAKPRALHVTNLSIGGSAAPAPIAGYRQPKYEPRQQLQPQLHNRGGSISSASTTSALSAIINPQMLWPMPPMTPPVTGSSDNTNVGGVGGGHGRGQYIDFEHSGQTVVKINKPPVSLRRPGTGRRY